MGEYTAPTRLGLSDSKPDRQDAADVVVDFAGACALPLRELVPLRCQNLQLELPMPGRSPRSRLFTWKVPKMSSRSKPAVIQRLIVSRPGDGRPHIQVLQAAQRTELY